MKRLPILLICLLTVPLLAQEAKKQPSATDETMAMYVEMAKPVADHKRITDLAGKWKVVTKFWFDPSAPITATGTSTAKPILGGRFVQIDTKLTGAAPHDSMTIVGFDRRTSDYTMVGYDTLGTYYITAAGKYDDARKTMALNGTYLQPPTNVEQKYRFDWKFASRDENVMTLYFAMPDGKEMLVAETTMTRTK